MADHRTSDKDAGHVTIIERKTSSGAIIIAAVLIIAVVIGAIYLLNVQNNANRRDQAIASAAQSVSDAADKVGSAATGRQDDGSQ